MSKFVESNIYDHEKSRFEYRLIMKEQVKRSRILGYEKSRFVESQANLCGKKSLLQVFL